MRKLVLLYFLVACIPIGGLGSYSISKTREMILRQHETQVIASSSRAKNVLFNISYLAGKLSDTIVFDTSLYKIISRQYASSDDVYEVYRDYNTLTSAEAIYNQFSSIKVYVNNDTMVTSGNFVVVNNDTRKQSWYQEVEKSKGSIIWVNNGVTENNLQLVRKIVLPQNQGFAVVVISISNNYLKLMVGDSQFYNVMAIGQDQIFYSNYKEDLGDVLSSSFIDKKSLEQKAYEITYHEKKMLACSNTLKPVGSSQSFEFVTLDSYAMQDLNATRNLILFIIFTCLILSFIIIVLFSYYFSRRVYTLRSEMNKVASGNFDVISTFSGKDELTELFDYMQSTIKNIKTLNEEVFKEKLAKEKLLNYQQRMNFEMLANQINPHFLFNTLETIRMKATLNNQKEITYIVKQLGKLLRFSLQAQNKEVTLSNELDYIRTYLDIQHFRFENKIIYSIHVENSLNTDHYSILPLLIQPVVENAIVHGLERKLGIGHMWISISIENEFLQIQVEDDGVGIPEQNLCQLTQYMQNERTEDNGCIGIRNIYRRIRLYYGNNSDMKIQSKVDEGTKVTIKLPLNRKDSEYDKSINC